MVSIKYLYIVNGLSPRISNRQLKMVEKQFDQMNNKTYKFFPPVFFIDMFVGNFMYFAFDPIKFKTCANYNE